MGSFIGNEMFKGMQNSIQLILNQHNINNKDLRQETINFVLKCLTQKRDLDKEQKQYTKRLINISLCMCILSLLL